MLGKKCYTLSILIVMLQLLLFQSVFANEDDFYEKVKEAYYSQLEGDFSQEDFDHFMEEHYYQKLIQKDVIVSDGQINALKEAVNAKSVLNSIDGFRTDKVSPQKVWTDITFTCEADGQNLIYDYYVYKDGVYQYNTGSTHKHQFKWRPLEPGNYLIEVEVSDVTGYTLKRSINYAVDFFSTGLVESGYYLEKAETGLLAVNGHIEETINAEDVYDVYKFVPEYTGEYDFDTSYYYELETLVYDSSYKLVKKSRYYSGDVNDIQLIKGQEYYVVVRERDFTHEVASDYRIYCHFTTIQADKSTTQPAGTTIRFTYFDTGLNDYYYRIYDEVNNQEVLSEHHQSSHTFEYTFNEAGEYIVSIGKEGGALSGIVVRITEPLNDDEGDSFEEARPIGVGADEYAIDYAGDNDYFLFTAPVAGSYRFYTAYTDERLDTYGYLYSSSEELQYADDDGGDGLNFEIDRDLAAQEQVYIKVRAFSSDKTGSYSLHVDIENALKVSPRNGCLVNEAVTIVSNLTEGAAYYQFKVVNSEGVTVLESGNREFNYQPWTPRVVDEYIIRSTMVNNNGQSIVSEEAYSVTNLSDVNGQGLDSPYVINAGSSINGAIDHTWDRDYFRLFMAESGWYHVWIDSEAHLRLKVYKKVGEDYVYDREGTYNGDSPLELTDSNNESKDYIFQVYDDEGLYTGNYTIRCEKLTMYLHTGYRAYSIGETVHWTCTEPIAGAQYQYDIVNESLGESMYSSGLVDDLSGSFIGTVPGEYTLKTRVHPLDNRSDFVTTDSFVITEKTDIQGNLKEEALSVNEGEIIIVDAYYKGDEDWIAFTPEKTSIYTLSFTELLSSGSYEIAIEVQSENGNGMYNNHLNGYRGNASNELYLTGGNTYYINLNWRSWKDYLYGLTSMRITNNAKSLSDYDFNKDGIVNIHDVVKQKNAYGTNHNTIYDVNNDGIVDLLDIVATLINR